MMWMESGRSSGLASITLLLPQQKIAEDRLALLLGQISKRRALVLEECREFGAGRLVGYGPFLSQSAQHLLRDARPGPPRHSGGEIYVAPFGVPRRLAKFSPFIEKCLREPFNPTVAITALGPVIDCQYRRSSKSLHWMALRHQARIFFARQLAHCIVVGEELGEGNRKKVQAGA